MREFKLQIDAKAGLQRLGLILIGTELLFVLLDLLINYNAGIPVGSVQRLFNIAREDSLPAWAASVQTLFVGLVVWAIYWIRRRRAWAVVAGFFTYLAVDDGAKFHERVGTAVKQTTEVGRDIAADHSYTWQYVFGPFFVAMGLFILWFMWREMKSPRLRAAIFMALACYGFAVMLDFVEGLPSAYDQIAQWSGTSSRFINHFGRVLEEFLELLGTSLFLLAFLSHFISLAPRTVVAFRD